MKVVLPDALHARPANLLVRLASQHDALVKLRRGERCANARKILDVLALGAAKGEEIEIIAEGEGAEAAARALVELVARNFDRDLVPERGSGAVEGLAIGHAILVAAPASLSATASSDEMAIDPGAERSRLEGAGVRALADLSLLIDALPIEERALFEPERAILREIVAAVVERIDAGARSEEAVVAVTENAATDLIRDARSRLLEALSDDDVTAGALARLHGATADVVIVVEELTPSLVARLPSRVRGIVAVDDADDAAGAVRTSHAAILARGRELPLALVPSHVAAAIVEGDLLLVDTTDAAARVWISPSEALVDDARTRMQRRAASGGAAAIAVVSQTLDVSLLVNVSSLRDQIPEGVAGVGLVRTELLFAGRTSAPTEGEQVSALVAVGRAARGGPVTARLWDAGGDKPLPWLQATGTDARGAALLFAHPAILSTQLKAISRASERLPLRVLIPMVRGVGDVAEVRRQCAGVAVGAMIETPEAADDADAIAAVADFVCIGTNDLASLVLGVERTDAAQALDPRVLRVIARVVESARAPGKKVTVCGEIAGDPRGARMLVGLGVHALSVAPPRLQHLVASLDGVTLAACRADARLALEEPSLP